MDKVRNRVPGGVVARAAALFLCVFLCFVFLCFVFLCFSIRIPMGDDEEQSKKPSFWEWQRMRSAFSIYSAPFRTGQNWLDKVKTLVNQAYARFFLPPNLDFRREAKSEAVTDGGTGEKVKEALAKSLGKSKATVEDTAKSAASIAGETVHKAKAKVKRSLSEERETERQNEL